TVLALEGDRAENDPADVEQVVHQADNVLDLPLFFFQAEDGIRDLNVTGVQTCALPISIAGSLFSEIEAKAAFWQRPRRLAPARVTPPPATRVPEAPSDVASMVEGFRLAYSNLQEIGRASCREGGESGVVAGPLRERIPL